MDAEPTLARALYDAHGGCCLHGMISDGNLWDDCFDPSLREWRFGDCQLGDANAMCIPVYEWLRGLDERTRFAWYCGRWERPDYDQVADFVVDSPDPA